MSIGDFRLGARKTNTEHRIGNLPANDANERECAFCISNALRARVLPLMRKRTFFALSQRRWNASSERVAKQECAFRAHQDRWNASSERVAKQECAFRTHQDRWNAS